MKKRIISFVIIGMFLLTGLSSFSAVSMNIDNGSENEIKALDDDPIIIKKYAQEYRSIDGDVRHFDATHLPGGSDKAIRMGQGIIPREGHAYYDFYIPDVAFNPSMVDFGFECCDVAEVPLSPGAELHLYNWQTEKYDNKFWLGEHDNLQWVWMGFVDNYKYIQESDGKIKMMIKSDGYDDTIIDEVAVRYYIEKPLIRCSEPIVEKVKKGTTFTGEFYIENYGYKNTLLDWEVYEWPEWGEDWEITPKKGYDLGSYEKAYIDIKVKLPNRVDSFWGEIFVRDIENPSEYDCVIIDLKTTRDRAINSPLNQILERFFGNFPLLERFLSNFRGSW